MGRGRRWHARSHAREVAREKDRRGSRDFMVLVYQLVDEYMVTIAAARDTVGLAPNLNEHIHYHETFNEHIHDHRLCNRYWNEIHDLGLLQSIPLCRPSAKSRKGCASC